MKKITKMLSVFLSMLCIISAMPLGIFSVGKSNEKDTDEKNYNDKNEVIVREEATLRGEFERHFLTEDGSFFAVSYAYPVNYYNGYSWLAIDNSLKLDEYNGYYTSKNEGFKTKFLSNISNSSERLPLASVESKGFSTSWNLLFSNGEGKYVYPYDAKAMVDNGSSNFKTVTEAGALGAAMSKITYENAYGEVDVRYTITHGSVKEDIILKKPSPLASYKAVFELKKDEKAKLQDDGSVLFYNGRGEILFSVTLPYAYDAKGESNYNFKVKAENYDTRVEIFYFLDAEWFASDKRVYPIIIDPIVTASTSSSNVDSAWFYMTEYQDNGYVTNNNFNSSYIYVAESPTRAYIKMGSAPTLPVGSVLESGDVNFSIFYEESSLVVYGSPSCVVATKITSPCRPFGTPAPPRPAFV